MDSKTEGLNKPSNIIAKNLKIFRDSKLIDKLSHTRAINFNDWIEVGKNLYGASQGTQEGLDLWKQFTENNPGEFTQDCCEKEWNEFKEIEDCEGTYSLHNLLKMIEKDNSNCISKYISSSIFSLQDLQKITPKELNNFLYRSPEIVANELRLVKDYKLIDSLKDWRANKTYFWMDIGEILYSIGQGSEMALDLWIEFTEKKSKKFTRDDCIQRWNDLPLRSWDFHFLHKIAQEDNPEISDKIAIFAQLGLIGIVALGSLYMWFNGLKF